MKKKLNLFIRRVSVIINDENRKSISRILKESLHFWIVKKEIPYFYFGKFLYRKDVSNYKDYLSSKEVDKITLSKKLHRIQFSKLLRNKLSFALFMEENNFPVPQLVSYNHKNQFYLNSKPTKIDSEEKLLQFFESQFNLNEINGLFLKSTTGMGGKGCFLINRNNLHNQVTKYYKEIVNDDFVHQKIIVQHPKINMIYQHSINTIRFTTYIDKNGEKHILSAFMRFGSGGSFIDNSSAGGICVSVDLKEGKLKGKSHQLMKHGGKQLIKHPDSNIIFNDFQIPYFEESKELVLTAITLIPDRIIGWDIAIGKKGPILVEGNDNNSLITPDIIYGGYLKNPIFKEILEEA
ncbi:sugar-transfer associated ATP-grasp domain-containing protein [uncultured Aquimarina sp.]|uniref:sugar-transfer associated ATP-grasp domain-containing protein n=1 Tax=uncultured Aquimarina sp. TaxID=575652 RepID=UPI00263615FD|nr:sugar-transfer associated ATP-grasp domain-containing protein [uncultured Aquimarina sp.]